MSKNKRSTGNNGTGPAQQDGNDDAMLHTFSTGVTLEILVVPEVLIRSVVNRIELPEQPTKQYKLDIPGDDGDEVAEEVPLDESTATTDEDKKRLEEYNQELAGALNLRRQREAEMLLLEGVRIIDHEQMEQKLDRLHKRYGLDIPEDEDERKLFYLRHCAIGEIEMFELRMMIYERQGLGKETLDSIRGSFRRLMEEEAARALQSTEVGVEL